MNVLGFSVLWHKGVPARPKSFVQIPTIFLGLMFTTAIEILPVQAAPPSFDCSSVIRADEIAVCKDSELSELDVALNNGFLFLKRHVSRKKAVALARTFIQDRQSCGEDKLCILQVSQIAIDLYNDAGANIIAPTWLEPRPTICGLPTCPPMNEPIVQEAAVSSQPEDQDVSARVCHSIMGSFSRWDGQAHSLEKCKQNPDAYSQDLLASNDKIAVERKAAGLSTDGLPDNRPLVSRMIVLGSHIEGFSVSPASISPEMVEADLGTLNQWSKDISFLAHNVKSEAEKTQMARLRAKMENKQREVFPNLRRSYADAIGKLLWTQDVTVTVSGSSADTIEFAGYPFASNAAIMDFQTRSVALFKQYRFREVRYKFYKEADKFEYFRSEPVPDKDVVVWTGATSAKVF